MDSFFKDLGNFDWWLSVVVLGIAINLVSQFLPKLFMRLLGLVSEKVQKQNTKIRESIYQKATWCIDHPHEIQLLHQKMWANAILLMLSQIFAIVVFSAGSISIVLKPEIKDDPALTVFMISGLIIVIGVMSTSFGMFTASLETIRAITRIKASRMDDEQPMEADHEESPVEIGSG